MIAIMGSIAKIGLEATAIVLERISKSGATVDDAIAACRTASAKKLSDFIEQAK